MISNNAKFNENSTQKNYSNKKYDSPTTKKLKVYHSGHCSKQIERLMKLAFAFGTPEIPDERSPFTVLCYAPISIDRGFAGRSSSVGGPSNIRTTSWLFNSIDLMSQVNSNKSCT